MSRSLPPAALVLAATLLATAGRLDAQGQTWIVDQNNGAGTNFTDLPTAVAAVAHGDTLVIRAGRYFGFGTSKGLTLLGQGGVTIVDALVIPPLSVVVVSGLPRDRAFVLKNVRIEASFSSGILSLANNLGRIHLENVDLALPVVTASPIGGCLIGACTEVTFVNGNAYGFPAMRISASVVALAGTTVRGGNHCGSSRCPWVGEGISVLDSTLQLARANVSGGGGFGPLGTGQAAIHAFRSLVYVTGDPNTSILAGGGFGGPVNAIETSQGTIHLDPRVVVLGANGGADVAGTALVIRRRIVALSGAGGPPGGSITAEIVSPSGDPFVFAISLPSDPLPHQAGNVFVDPRFLALFGFGVQGPNERFPVTLAVPSDPALRGIAIALQAASHSLAQQETEFSNPLVVVLD